MLVYQISPAGFELFFMTLFLCEHFLLFCEISELLTTWLGPSTRKRTLTIVFLSNIKVDLFNTQMLYRRLGTDLDFTSSLNCWSNII